MVWNKTNIIAFELEPIGYINQFSFNFEAKTIRVNYENCDKYPGEEDKSYEIFGIKNSFREFKCENIFENKDKINRLLIYLEFVKKISAKLIIDDEIKIHELYFSLSLNCSDIFHNSFSTFDDLYDKFLQHLNINKDSYRELNLDYYILEKENFDRQNDELKRNDQSIENFYNNQNFGNDNPSYYNDNLDMDQQSPEFWDDL